MPNRTTIKERAKEREQALRWSDIENGRVEPYTDEEIAYKIEYDKAVAEEKRTAEVAKTRVRNVEIRRQEMDVLAKREMAQAREVAFKKDTEKYFGKGNAPTDANAIGKMREAHARKWDAENEKNYPPRTVFDWHEPVPVPSMPEKVERGASYQEKRVYATDKYLNRNPNKAYLRERILDLAELEQYKSLPTADLAGLAQADVPAPPPQNTPFPAPSKDATDLDRIAYRNSVDFVDSMENGYPYRPIDY